MFRARATQDAYIPTLHGHCFSVQAGVTYEFPDVVKTDVILAGCIPVADAPEVKPEPEVAADDDEEAESKPKRRARRKPDELPPPNIINFADEADRANIIQRVVGELLVAPPNGMLSRNSTGAPSVFLVRNAVGDDTITVEEVAAAVAAIRSQTITEAE